MRILRMPVGLLWATQPLDIITTGLLLRSGAGHEGNPLTAYLLHLGGLPLVLLLKLGLVGLITLGALRHPAGPAAGRHKVLIVAAIYTLVVAWNATLLLVR